MLSPEQVEEIKAQAFAGVPTELQGICKIYPLTMKEILEIGYSKYIGYLGLLLLDEIKIADIVKEKTGQELSVEQINPLTYLLMSAQQNDSFLLDLQNILSTFIKEEVLLLPSINAVVVGNPEEQRLITPMNFQYLQDILRIQNRYEIKEGPPKDETPGERKMRLLREKVVAVKKKQAAKNTDGTTPLSVLLEVAEVYGIDWRNRTLYAFHGLVRRHQAKEKWDDDLRMICAGADASKIQTNYWGDDLDKK